MDRSMCLEQMDSKWKLSIWRTVSVKGRNFNLWTNFSWTGKVFKAGS